MSPLPSQPGARRFASALFLALAAWIPAAAGGAADPAPARELAVPSADLHLLFRSPNARVLMSRDEYEALKRLLLVAEAARPPATGILSRVDARIELGEGDGNLSLDADLDMLARGPLAMPFALPGVDVLRADLDGKPAVLGRAAEGGLVLFVEGEGRHRLTLSGRLALATSSARQSVTLGLPPAGAKRLTLASPGDVELKAGAAVIRREYDEARAQTRFELAPPPGSFTLSLSLNNRQKRREPVVTVNSAQVSRIGDAHEEWQAVLRVSVRHYGLRSQAFQLPVGMEIHEVDSEAIDAWRVEPDGAERRLVMSVRDDQPGEFVATVRGSRPLADNGGWTFPVLRPVNAASHAVVMGLWLEARSRLESASGEGLVSGDRSLLAQIAPALARGGDVAAGVWFAPQGMGSWSGRITRPAPGLQATAHGVVTFSGQGLKSLLGVTLAPRLQTISDVSLRVPPGWRVVAVRADSPPDPSPWPFETAPMTNGFSRLSVRLPVAVSDGGALSFVVEAEHTPPDWWSAWTHRNVEVSIWPVLGADQQAGALVAEGLDDLSVSPAALSGLAPMDEQDKKAGGIPGNAGLPAYRYEGLPASATLAVRRLSPRLTAENFIFSRLEPDQVLHTAEVLLRVVDAGLREVKLRVPASFPDRFELSGSGAADVGAWRIHDAEGAREIAVELDRRASDQIRLVLKWPEPLSIGAEGGELALPWIEVLGAAYQSSRVCLEGHAELEARVLEAPRAVDVGELADAQTLPGNRVAGVFASSGKPAPVRVRVTRPGLARLPGIVVESARLETVIDGLGTAQTRALFRLRSKADFLEVQLPGPAEFWSASFAGQPLQPSLRGAAMVFDLPPALESAGEFEILYETRGAGLSGLSSRLQADPPTLWVPEQGVQPRQPVSVLRMDWRLYVPAQYDLMSSSGAMAPDGIRRPRPAALAVGRWLYQLSGGIDPNRGLAGCAAVFSSSALRRPGKEVYASDFIREDAAGAVPMTDVREEAAADRDDLYAPAGEPADTPGPRPSTRPSRPDSPAQPVVVPPAKPGRKSEKSKLAWYEKGVKGLHIDLLREGRTLSFHSLTGTGNLDIRLIHQKRNQWLALTAGLAVFSAGLLLRAHRIRYLLLALAAASLLPALPGALPLTQTCNGAFLGAILLPAGWLAVRLRRRLRQGIAALADRFRPVAGVLLLAAGLSALGPSLDARAHEEEAAQPVVAPDSAVVIPLAPDATRPSADNPVLVPYALYTRWKELVAARADAGSVAPPADVGWAGLAAELSLDDAETLLLRGTLRLELFRDGPHAIPLSLHGAAWSRATLDQRPAPLRPLRNPGEYELIVSGRGTHTLVFECSLAVKREGGWRSVSGRLPSSPASVLKLKPAADGLEIFAGGRAEPVRTAAAMEEIDTPVAADGSFSVRWRPKLAGQEVDRSLAMDSYAVFDLREDIFKLTWESSFQFRNGQRSAFEILLPAGYLLEQVDGANIRGWEAAPEDDRRVTLHLLKPAEKSDSATLRLWKKAPVALPHLEPVPVVRSPEALRQTGNLVLRSSPWLDMRSAPGEGLRRANLDAPALARRPLVKNESGPLGLKEREQYEFADPSFQARVEILPVPLEVKASVRSLLWVDVREHRLEGSVVLEFPRRPLRDVRIAIPDGFKPSSVAGLEGLGWQVEPSPGGRDLVIALPAGVLSRLELVVTGVIRAGEGPVPLPRLEPRGVMEARESWVVQAGGDYDVSLQEAVDVEQIPVHQVSWLKPDQRPAARLALEGKGPGPRASLALTRRQAKVGGTVFASARFTDRSIEETILLEFNIEQAGTRRLRFALPAHLGAARVRAPMVRRQEISAPRDGEVEVTLDLLESITGAYRVLIEHDRALVLPGEPLRLARLLDAETYGRFIAVESAGRDEMEWTPSAGLEPLGSQQKDWARMRAILSGRISLACADNGREPHPALAFSSRPREVVQTAGARIGLAETLLVLDEGGAYRGLQTYRLDNRTEAWLEIELPAGAELFSAKVAGAPVKPAAGGRGGRIRLPLVKTSAGDLDYSVEMIYGGTLARSPGLRQTDLPLPKALNINAEISQAEVRLPRSRKWFDFGGTMSPLSTLADYEAGRLRYQKQQARQLLALVESGQEFEKARAINNWKLLEQDSEVLLSRNLSNAWNASNAGAQEELKQLVQQGRVGQAAAAKDLIATPDDNRGRLNDLYGNQRIALSNTSASQGIPNFSSAQTATPEEGATAQEGQSLAGYVTKNGLVQSGARGKADENGREGQKKSGSGKLTSGDGKEQAGRFFGSNVGKAEKTADPFGGGGGGGLGNDESQLARVQRYQHRLATGKGQSPAGNQPLDGNSRAADKPSLPEQKPDAGGAASQGGDLDGRGEASLPASRGLGSLELAFPAADGDLWSSYYFATPRGQADISVRAVSAERVESLERLVLVLVVLAVAGLVLRFASRAGRTPRRLRRASTFSLFASVLALLIGVLPFLALVLLLASIVWRVKAGRALAAAKV